MTYLCVDTVFTSFSTRRTDVYTMNILSVLEESVHFFFLLNTIMMD